MNKDSNLVPCVADLEGDARGPGPGPAPERISIVIPHLKDHARLRDCLLGVRGQIGVPFEVLVAENGSIADAAATVALIKETGVQARVLLVEERGAGPARNAGSTATSGEVLAFLDADCRPAPDWLAQGAAGVRRFGIIGGPMLVTPLFEGPMSAVEAWDVVFGHNAERSYRRNHHLLGGNMFIRRDIFERVGPFRNGLPEDRDWCERARDAGYEIAFDPLLIVEHPPLTSYAAIERRWVRMTTEESVRARGLSWGRLRFALRSWIVLLSIAPHLVRIARFKAHGGEASAAAMARILFSIRWRRFAVTWRLLLRGSAS